MKGIQDTSNKTYRQLMGNALTYEVPKFQRDYTWDKPQWDDLWFDVRQLMSNEESEHYMGYLVLQTEDNKKFKIIDGQQRITTLSIMILAAIKSINNLVDNEIEEKHNRERIGRLLDGYIGYINPVTLIASNKLKLNRNSDDYYRRYMVLLKDLPTRNINSSEKQMRSCFLWFYEKIKQQYTTGEELAGFIDYIVDKLFFTVIEVTDQLNAFKVFETLNARGVQLSSADLLKNYLFSLVDEEGSHKSEIEELEHIWNATIDKLENKKVEDYLRYYWNSFNKVVRKNHLFKTIKNEITTKRQAFAIIRNLMDTADLYMAIQDPEDEFWRETPAIRKNLTELKLFQVRQTYSLLISGYTNLALEDFSRLVKYLLVISFRYNVIGGFNPNEQEYVYNAIARNIFAAKQLDGGMFQEVYVADDSFENDFAGKQFKNSGRNHKIVKYIFSRLEKSKYANDIPFTSDLYSVEHILPENGDENWGNFTNEQINRSIYRLGNLTLLEKKLNREAADKIYSEKKAFYRQSRCKTTNAVVEYYDSWSEEKISARQHQLAKTAKSVWKIDELSRS